MNTRKVRVSDAGRQKTVEAVALFAVLMHADEAGELQDAAEAQRQLDRLGVAVRFPRHRGQPEGAGP